MSEQHYYLLISFHFISNKKNINLSMYKLIQNKNRLLLSKSFQTIQKLANIDNFSLFSKYAWFLRKDQQTLQNILETDWNDDNEEILKQIFKRSNYIPMDEIVFVVVEKLDGSNIRFVVDVKDKLCHFMSKAVYLRTSEEMKTFFGCEKTLKFHLPYLTKVVNQAIETKLIPETATRVYLTCEMVGGKTGAKNPCYWNHKDTPLMLIPIDLSFDLQGVSKCVPYTTNWWDVDIEGFKLARKAPEPLLVTSNLEEALLTIVRHKNTVSKLCSLIEPSERGNTLKEGCILRIIKKNDDDKMYKYVYSDEMVMTKYENEIYDKVQNMTTQFGLDFDYEIVAQCALNELAEEIKYSPSLRTMAKEFAIKKLVKNKYENMNEYMHT